MDLAIAAEALTMRWIERPEILYYVVECYAGTEDVGGNERRVFLWEDGDFVRMGNVEAFFLHLRERFSLLVSNTGGPVLIHEALRQMGEQLRVIERRAPNTAIRNTKRPEPESWIVHRGPPI